MPEDHIRHSRTAVIDDAVLGTILGPLQDQHPLLTAESSVHLLNSSLLK